MKTRRALVLKGIICRQGSDLGDELEKLLPIPEQRTLSELPVVPMEEINEEVDLLEKVHWSWFLPTLKSHSSEEQKQFLASLETQTASSLAQELQISPATHPVSKSGREFLREVLFHSLVGPENQLIPIHCLPLTPLNKLLHFSKKELIQLIDRLSLYDLAAEMRQIVETKILKKIYSFLTEEQKQFLKVAMGQKESYHVPRIGLDKWDGSKTSFSHLLHKRGLARLGAALSGQDPDLIWYICHQLDIGRGNALFKFCAKEKGAEWGEAMLKQIEECLR